MMIVEFQFLSVKDRFANWSEDYFSVYERDENFPEEQDHSLVLKLF